jgi:signal transduction histidine kinase/outer membrane protein assembly factor BamB
MNWLSPVPALMLLPAALAAAGVPASVDLRGRPDRLPYEFRIVETLEVGLCRDAGWITRQLRGDMDGDGLVESFRANETGIIGSLPRSDGPTVDWQTNLPVAFTGRGPCASVDGVWDLDGDGGLEVVATASTAGGALWRIIILDADDGSLRAAFELPGGPDHRPDGRWDGHYRVFGPLLAGPATGPRPAIVVGVEAGFDLDPRGMQALDVETGEVLWRYLTGPKPVASSVHVVDLDGDGRQETCFLGAGVSNLGGNPRNGTTDDKAMLFVLAADGALRWSKDLGAAPASGWLDVMDLDADGRQELIVSAHLPEIGRNALAVLDVDGTLLTAVEVDAAGSGIAVKDESGPGAVVYLTTPGRVGRYRVAPGRITLEVEARTDGPTGLALVADVVDVPGREVFISAPGERNWMLSADLRPLAVLHDRDFLLWAWGVSAHRGPGGAMQVLSLGTERHTAAVFALEAVARPVPWALMAAGAGLAGGAGITGMAWRRRARRPSASAVGELRLQLLDRLRAADHGRIGALSSPRRLVMILGAAEGGLVPADEVAGRLRELGGDFLESGLPDLAAAAELAGLAGLDPEVVRSARSALERLRTILERMLRDPATADPAVDRERELRNAIAQADDLFRQLRRAVEQEFRADPRAICERALAAHADDIARLGVAVSLDEQDAPACLVDAGELAFVIDNLIENAIRAMRATAERRLTVRWRADGGLVAIEVADTGCGMTPGESEAALSAGPGKREGGGSGLPGSRQRLEKYGGALTVAQTGPGRGTTMSLHVPRAAG